MECPEIPDGVYRAKKHRFIASHLHLVYKNRHTVFHFLRTCMFKVIWRWLFWWVCSNVLVIMSNSIWAWFNAWVIKRHIFWVSGVGASYPLLSMNYLLYDINLPNSDNNTVTWVLCLHYSENSWDYQVMWLKVTNYRSETDIQTCSSMTKLGYPSFSVWEIPRHALTLAKTCGFRAGDQGGKFCPWRFLLAQP